MKKWTTIAILMAGLAIVASAQNAPVTNNIFAQKLVDGFTTKYVRLISMGIHAKAPGADKYHIVAHTLKKLIGHESTPDDMSLMQTGIPDGPNSVEGGIFDVAIPLHNSGGKVIGVMAVHIKPGPGDPKAETLKLAYQIRSEFEKQIPNNARLFAPTH